METIIQTYAADLNPTLNFYTKLDFEHRTIGGKEYAVSNVFAIELNTNAKARTGLKLYLPNLIETKQKLNSLLNSVESDGCLLITTPSGCRVYLDHIENTPKISFTPVQSLLGNFMGMSLETTDIEQSLLIWKILGFKISAGKKEQGWVLLANDSGFSVSLMASNSCPHRCIIPSITFFNGKKNTEIIKNIRRLNIPITEKITAFNSEGIVDNIIVQDPGGLGFFIFND